MSIIHNISVRERTRPGAIPSETIQEFLGTWVRMAAENVSPKTNNNSNIYTIFFYVLENQFQKYVENPYYRLLKSSSRPRYR